MRTVILKRSFNNLISILLVVLSNIAFADTAFFYGPNAPLAELSQFDQLVLQSEHYSKTEIRVLKSHKQKVFAYLSIGEIANPQANQRTWIKQSNRQWRSGVVDPLNQQWQQWLLSRVPAIVEKGYDGLFLDTLDSYQQIAANDVVKLKYQQALVDLVIKLKKDHPNLKLIFNRGFELLDQLGEQHASDLVHGLVAESLFRSWDHVRRRYISVPNEDSQWLLNKLQHYQQWGIPITVIDYVKPDNRKIAEDTVAKISNYGFNAWVSEPSLSMLGFSAKKLQSRRILFIYDSLIAPLALNPAHTILGNSFDYLGLRVDYHDIRSGPPTQNTQNLYTAVATWLDSGHSTHLNALENWLQTQLKQKTKLLVFNGLPFKSSELLNLIGLSAIDAEITSPLQAVYKSNFIDKKTRITQRITGLKAWVSNSQDNTVLLKINDANKRQFTPIVSSSWGGIALAPFLYTESKPGYRRWLIDPVEFLSLSLKLPARLIPDTTTENGRRIMLSHVDGDGFVSKAELAGTPYSAEVCYDEILKKYDIAHTVSVIEGEIGPTGLYPQQSPVLEEIAKKIFALENVEAASHSFSHPFVWQPGKYKGTKTKSHDKALSLTGYKAKTEREVQGSIDYINRRLLSDGKKVKVMLWTGDALPGDQDIEGSYSAGVVNVNGGNTKLTTAYPSSTGIYPQLRPTQAGIQVYAPVMNENIYTNEWLGPFYGFSKVIETFKLTGEPRRYKPISIYWHFYSGTKSGALLALHDVYQWVLATPHVSLFLSEFADRVKGFQQTAITKINEQRFAVSSLGALRTLRADKALGYPQPALSDGLAGYNDTKQGRYLHLSKDRVEIQFSNNKDTSPYLYSSNAKISYWRTKDKEISFQLVGSEPVEMELKNANSCKLTLSNNQMVVETRKKLNLRMYKFTKKDTGHALLVC